jgi:hypothetical protein
MKTFQTWFEREFPVDGANGTRSNLYRQSIHELMKAAWRAADARAACYPPAFAFTLNAWSGIPGRSAEPHDAALANAIIRAAGVLRFDNRPGSLERQCILGLFVAALSDRLALAFPNSADALKAVVFSPATDGNPAETPHPQSQQRA